jgi:hypothetical protein
MIVWGKEMENLCNAAFRSRSFRPLSLTLAISLALNGALPAALADTGGHAPSATGDDRTTGAVSGPRSAGALTSAGTFDVADDATPAAAPPQSAPAAAPSAPSALSDKAAQENMFWDSAQRSNSAADYKAYLDAYPNGLYAPLAKNRIAALNAAPPPAAPPPAPVQAMAPQVPTVPSAFGPPPPPVTPEALKSEVGTVDTEQTLNMGPPARMELQQRLSAIGLYNGPIDGDLGPGVRAAIAEWQKRHNVAPTGEIGPLQLAVLREESEPAFQQMAAAPRPGPVYVAHPVYYPAHRVVHAYQAPSYAAPAVLGVLGGLAIGLLGAKLGGKGGGGKGGGGKGGGHEKKH